MAEINKHFGGLLPLEKDSRDFRFGAIYKLPLLSELPDEFFVCEPLTIKDQGDTDYCTAFAGTAVVEDHEQVELDPMYQIAQTMRVIGKISDYGADLRSVAKSFVKHGALEKKDAIFSIETSRDKALDWNMYKPELEAKAAIHKQSSFMFVTGPYDFFDNVKATLWARREKRDTIETGTIWCNEWTNVPCGIINFKGTPAFGHALKFYGWKVMNGEECLIAQLSNGQDIGDHGRFYFTREIVNDCFAQFGAVVFTDMTREEAEYYALNGISVHDNWLLSFIKIIINLFR